MLTIEQDLWGLSIVINELEEGKYDVTEKHEALCKIANEDLIEIDKGSEWSFQIERIR